MDSHISRVVAALQDHVASQGHARADVSATTAPGPAGATVVRAAAANAYPGSGVATALVADDGRAYGDAQPLGFADFARAHGWLTAPPSPAEAADAVSYLRFHGLLQLDGATTVERPPGRLRLRLTRRSFPSGARETLRIDVAAAGPEEVATEPDSDPPEPVAIDDAVALLRALDAGDAAASLRAIRAVAARPPTPRGQAALARAALSPNETLASDALAALGEDDAAVAALRAALASAPPTRREAVLALVDGLFGPELAARLGDDV